MKTYGSLSTLLTFMSKKDGIRYHSFNELVDVQKEIFNQHFSFYQALEERVELWFDSSELAQQFYLYLILHDHFTDYRVRFDETFKDVLIVTPVFDVRSLLLNKEGSLRDICAKLDLHVRLRYRQSFSGSTLELELNGAHLSNAFCQIQVSQSFPYLSLGLLHGLMATKDEYMAFNSHIKFVE